MPGNIRCVVLRSVKEDSSALIQQLAIASGDTVGHWTAGPDKRFLSQSEIEIVCVVVLGPKEQYFGLSCFWCLFNLKNKVEVNRLVRNNVREGLTCRRNLLIQINLLCITKLDDFQI